MLSATRRILLAAVILSAVPTLLILHANFWPAEGWHDRFGYVLGRDFSNFWMAGRLAAEGQVAAIYDLQAYHGLYRATLAPQSPFMNFSYLPNSLPLLLPLGLLPYGAALALWLLVGLAGYHFAATGSILPRRGNSWTTALALSAPAALLAFCVGQASFLLAGLMVGGFRLLDRHPRLAGVCFGLLTIKPQLGLLIPVVLALRREWPAFASAAATGALLLACSLLAFGLEPWSAYLANTLPYQNRVINEPFGLVWSMMTTPFAFFVQTGASIATAKTLHALVAAAVVALSIAALRLRRNPAFDCAIVAFGAVLLSPYNLAYDLVMPTAALLWLLSRPDAPNGRAVLGLSALFLMLPVVMMLLNIEGLPVMPPVVVALFGAIMIEALRRERLDPNPGPA